MRPQSHFFLNSPGTTFRDHFTTESDSTANITIEKCLTVKTMTFTGKSELLSLICKTFEYFKITGHLHSTLVETTLILFIKEAKEDLNSDVAIKDENSVEEISTNVKTVHLDPSEKSSMTLNAGKRLFTFHHVLRHH